MEGIRLDSKERELFSSIIHPSSISEFTIPRTKQFVMYSRCGNREYRIFVAQPYADPPPSGFPVIYVLDANVVFGTMVEAMRVQAERPDRTGVIPTVIVGIGYPTERAFSPARFYDFTMSVPESELPDRPDGKAWPEMGGAATFLEFIETELKPKIEQELPIDRKRQAIFGHSLGGLFALQVLFTKPTAFKTYIAGSPSIHWSKQLLLEAEQRFVARIKQEALNVNVLLAAGELERSHKSRINVHAEELAERLSNLVEFGLYVEFYEFIGEGHISVLPALASRALRFASKNSM
ncbi:enterobactin esterase [Anoxybacillus ayderensis]|nr:alpha/beta hydrolase [Anoxybacillus ayderensis G10]MBW9219657.1 alpha/beta hydrolase [Anoxybacillus sp. ST70]THD16991.1 enterobactin esterase [Anoxybacillus ayderensis]